MPSKKRQVPASPDDTLINDTLLNNCTPSPVKKPRAKKNAPSATKATAKKAPAKDAPARVAPARVAPARVAAGANRKGPAELNLASTKYVADSETARYDKYLEVEDKRLKAIHLPLVFHNDKDIVLAYLRSPLSGTVRLESPVARKSLIPALAKAATTSSLGLSKEDLQAIIDGDEGDEREGTDGDEEDEREVEEHERKVEDDECEVEDDEREVEDDDEDDDENADTD